MVSCLACGISQRTKKDGVAFHRFPKKAEQRALWLNFVNRNENDIAKNSYLCSQHFKEEDFDRTSRLKLQLQKNSVPSNTILRKKYARGWNTTFLPATSNISASFSMDQTTYMIVMAPNVNSSAFERLPSSSNINSIPTKTKLSSYVERSMYSTPVKCQQNFDMKVLPISSISHKDKTRKRKLQKDVRKLSFKNNEHQQAKKIKKLQTYNLAQRRIMFQLTTNIKKLQNKFFYYKRIPSLTMYTMPEQQ